jgi:hypothetical protein
MMDADRRTHALVLVAVASCLSSLQADDGPRISTKKAAAVAPAAPRQTADDTHKNKKIAATVRLPNGDPAVGAQVVLYWDAAQVRLIFDWLSNSGARTRCAADNAGRFQLATPSDDFWIAIAHPSGFLRRRFGPNTVPAVIELAPWGRVEGTLRLGRKLQPAANLSIQLEDHDQHGPHDPWFRAFHTAKTDAAGHFVLEHVVPGRASISKNVSTGRRQGWLSSSAVYAILVQAGQTTKIDLGTAGRPVIGQLRVPPNSGVKVEAWFANIFVFTEDPKPHEPRSFSATVGDQGNFCIDDVPVGSYRMSAFIRAAGRIVQLDQFAVPAINEKLSQRPVDLGILMVDPRDGH